MQQATATATKLCVNTRGHILTATLISKFSTLQIKTNKKNGTLCKNRNESFSLFTRIFSSEKCSPSIAFFFIKFASKPFKIMAIMNKV
jgi:hypothetical protein